MAHNRYWNIEGGVAIGPLHPTDVEEAQPLLADLFGDSKCGVYFFIDVPAMRGADFYLTLDEEADLAARLSVNVPVVFLPKLLGRPLRSDGVPVIKEDGAATTLCPIV